MKTYHLSYLVLLSAIAAPALAAGPGIERVDVPFMEQQALPLAPLRQWPVRSAEQEPRVEAPVIAIAPTTPGINEVGGRNGEAAPSNSTGSSQTLRDATRTIIPSNYSVRPASCVPLQAPASWGKSDSWIKALGHVMTAHGLVATVDHDLKQVLIDRPQSLNPDAPRDWAVLRSDSTLRRALESWMAPACIQIEWDVPFPMDISADRIYRGVSLWDALRALAKELEESDTPIQIIRHPNVIRIASGQLR